MSYEDWQAEYTKRLAGQPALMGRDMRAAWFAALEETGAEYEYWDRTNGRWEELGRVNLLQVDILTNNGIKLRLKGD